MISNHSRPAKDNQDSRPEDEPREIMRKKTKWPRACAMYVAEEIQARLAPACLTITVAGSLRRGKTEVGDVEILYVPKMSKRPEDFFNERIISVADEVIEGLLNDGYFSKRPSRVGVFTWGESNKLAIHTASGIPVDLFSTSREKWWVSLVIRTGSKETNLRLTTGANKLNRTLNAYGFGTTDRATGETTAATSERHVFELCGVPYLEPENR
jgi:DNA polymerase/3'-5' exonuclease PolX